MKTATKASVGIDVSKDSLDACIGLSFSNQQHKFPTRATFPNTMTGFRKLLVWAAKQLPSKETPLWFVMEATGVYYENLAYFLTDNKRQAAVVLPTKMKHYAKTLETKSKTDQLDARAISQFGLERPLSVWIPPSAQLRCLKELSREHEALLLHATQVKNQLHARRHSHEAGESTIARLVAQRDLYKQQLRTIVQEMHSIVEHDADLNARITNITTANGLGVRGKAELESERTMLANIADQLGKMLRKGYAPTDMLAAAPAKDYESNMGDATEFLTESFKSLWPRFAPDA